MNIARINDEIITAENFIKILKLDNAFQDLIERILIAKLTVHVAKNNGITVSPEEVQQRVDEFRRLEGLHRSQDTYRFLDALGITLEEIEAYMTEVLYREKMVAQITAPAAIEEYFRLHSPKFDGVEISHIRVDSEDKAKELLALLEDEPDSFAELARVHSLDLDTKYQGGYIGKVLRGALAHEVEAKIFNAEPGDLLGPFVSDNELVYEIFQVNAKYAAKLDDNTAQSVAKMIYDDWLKARSQEHLLEVA